MKKLLLVLLLVFANTAYAQVMVTSRVDCGTWAKGRKADQSIAIEHLLVGTINGLALGAMIEIWQPSKGSVSKEQLYLWMDGWCLKNPLKTILQGAFVFADEQTNGAYTNRSLPK
jgi:hypothetical protein